MYELRRICISGYKSFCTVPFGKDALPEQEEGWSSCLEVGDITVLLGANGAGKSNLVSFFKMLSFITTGALQEYVAREGGSDSLLFYGRRITPRMQARVEFREVGERSHYAMTLVDAAPDTLVFTHESVLYHKEGHPQPQEVPLGSGHKESLLKEKADRGDETCRSIRAMLTRCRTYQFHDTSPTANIRKAGYIEDAEYLRADAGNLAAFLLSMRESHPREYGRLVHTIQMVFPRFDDFVLEASQRNPNYILLNWREKGGPEYKFGPHQLSDGTLRFMALSALFLQPLDNLPLVIVIDEPELGLHPYAITVLASMIQSAATRSQVILSTQSTRLVDEFGVEKVAVVERDEQTGCTRCHRPDAEKLEEWISRYTTSELWEKNVLGGRP